MLKRLNPLQVERLKRIRALARLLDDSLPVPGTNLRFGLDGILGLLPVAGDIVTTVLAAYIVREAAALGVPKNVLLKMIFNVSIDFLGGAVPLAGDAFDLIWKANKKNIALLEAHLKAHGMIDPDEPCIDV